MLVVFQMLPNLALVFWKAEASESLMPLSFFENLDHNDDINYCCLWLSFLCKYQFKTQLLK